MLKTSNKNARNIVENKCEFQGANPFGVWESKDVYVVYSYGKHFPMYACINGEWFETMEKYSVSTSKQQNQLRPAIFGEIYLIEGERLKVMINENCGRSVCNY